MSTKNIFQNILNNIDEFIDKRSTFAQILWKEFLYTHPADQAKFLNDINRNDAIKIFIKINHHNQLLIFPYLSNSMKADCLSFLNDREKQELLNSLAIDELTDFFDELSNEELEIYLKLIHKNSRAKVLSLMQFDPESAGGIMNSEVLTLFEDLTIQQSIKILQRLQPKKELHHTIFLTDRTNELKGYIKLEDLVLKEGNTRLVNIKKNTDIIIKPEEDRESVANKMIKYNLMIAPVTDKTNIFLGVITSNTLIDIIEKEASEDIYKISALKPIKNRYFETPFFVLFYQRWSILMILLLMQTFSTIILEYYNSLLGGFLIFFNGMIQSTGGNTSSQTSALVIQGMSSGDISNINRSRFFKREFYMAISIGISLGLISFIRIYITHPGNIIGNIAVSLSLTSVVIVSVILGSFIPFILKKLGLDPAFAAGPFLATIMDILGLLIYCFISQIILGN